MCFAGGALLALGLHFFIAHFWSALYASHPWKGSEWSMESGGIDPSFSESPRALGHTRIVLAVTGLGAGLAFREEPWSSILWIWSGIVLAFSVVSFMQPHTQDSNLAPIAPLLFAFLTGPALIGSFCVGHFVMLSRRKAPA